MKALTIRQPWAELAISGAKTEEYRSRPTSYRGTLAIHAGRALGTASDLLDWLTASQGGAELPDYWQAIAWMEAQPRGKLLGTVQLIGCRQLRTDEWGYRFGRWAWLFERPERWDKAIWALGKLGLWDLQAAG